MSKTASRPVDKRWLLSSVENGRDLCMVHPVCTMVSATRSRSRMDWRSGLLVSAVGNANRCDSPRRIRLLCNRIDDVGVFSPPWVLPAMRAVCRLGVEMSSRLPRIRRPLSAGASRTCQRGWQTLAARYSRRAWRFSSLPVARIKGTGATRTRLGIPGGWRTRFWLAGGPEVASAVMASAHGGGRL
ncbi:MAG: hypothetical protein QOI39_3073 [Mycobacterium sp.]|nr:hypothetical protein [Mycobacterium sp.]MDT5232573.1 hypothetical protein [Mycobacterium sp.]